MSIADVDPRAPDEEILRRAVAEDRVVVTNDLDFGELAVRRAMPHRGILILRVDEARSREKAAVLSMVVSQVGEDLVHHLSVYERGRLRIGHRREGE